MTKPTMALRRVIVVAGVALIAVAALSSLESATHSPAFAAEASDTPAAIGRAASGQRYFYPCASCHPVAPGTRPANLPIDFTGHQVVLVGHDVLGEGRAACLVCHGDPAVDPGKLRLVDGSLIDITGEVSRVCFGCHSATYREWEAGAHGRGEATCMAAGCHDPHTPQWIYGKPLLPFVGTGFHVRVVSEREPFTPLAGPPVAVPVYTPSWLVLVASVGAAVSAGIIGFLVRGRQSK